MKKFKMLVAGLMACVISLSLVACGGTPSAPAVGDAPSEDTNAPKEKIVWKLAHTCTENTALHKAAVEMADKISKATDGNFVIEIYPNSQLGGNREALEGMQFGTIEMAIPNATDLAGYSPKSQAFAMPYLIEDVSSLDAANKVFNSDVIDPVKDELLERGFMWMGSWTQGLRHLTTTKTAVHSPADLKGLKIRTMPSDIQMDHFNAIGANAVPMAFSELFTALQQGAVDGQENPYSNIYTQGMHEIQKYIIETAHTFDIVPLLCSKTAFDTLPEEYQKLLVEESDKMTMPEWEYSVAENEDYKKKIQDLGDVTIIELTTEERAVFKDAAQPVYDKWKDVIGADFLKAISDAQK